MTTILFNDQYLAQHTANMRSALCLARSGLGATGENPTVGCVIVDQRGRIVGSARTADNGRPHAETSALVIADSSAKGGTAYVTLEPCSHTGQTGPCCDALIQAGIKVVFVALKDPDPRVSGRGIERLQRSGIEVHVGLCEVEARECNRGFLSRVERGRPFVSLKIAGSLDGRIALASGESKWITSGAARAYGHRLRAENDAILVGIGTALADNPSLDCRLSGLEDKSPLRMVLDRRGQLPLNSQLVQSAAKRSLLVFSGSNVSNDWVSTLTKQSVEVCADAIHNKNFDLGAVLSHLAEKGISSVLVEGGGQTHAEFLRADLVDEIQLFSAPKIIGGDGRAAIGNLQISSMADLSKFETTSVERLGPDSLHVLRRK